MNASTSVNAIPSNIVGRQYKKSAFFKATVANFQDPANNNVLSLQMPPGSMVTGGSVNVTQASNETSTDTLSIGDSGSAARYHAAIDFKTAAYTLLTATGFIYTPANSAVTITRTPADSPDAATNGVVYILVDYVTLDEAQFTQG